ncbi:MAG TPA: hypothetical protein VE570_10560 [Thermoleophilaceae bacterium]|jgi:hypothetical protein|nr:hypothetical protein [Thermoleophilaceae bacterium]
MRKRDIRCVCAVVIILALTSVPAALASFPGANGHISFARYDADGFEQIWTANPDLTWAEQLTKRPAVFRSGPAALPPTASASVLPEDCAPEAEGAVCGRVDVPLDRSEPPLTLVLALPAVAGAQTNGPIAFERTDFNTSDRMQLWSVE